MSWVYFKTFFYKRIIFEFVKCHFHKNEEPLDSYREPTKAHKTYQGVPNMSYAFTGRYMFSFSGLIR